MTDEYLNLLIRKDALERENAVLYEQINKNNDEWKRVHLRLHELETAGQAPVGQSPSSAKETE